MERYFKAIRNYYLECNPRLVILRLTFGMSALLFANLVSAQDKLFDDIKFNQSEFNHQMVYIKWFSTGQKPAPDFLTFKYNEENPVEIKSIKMIYRNEDTTFYVMQDTLTAKQGNIVNESILQYFMVPHDTSGKVGTPSQIVLVSNKGNRWFSSTKAERINGEKGVKLTWKFSEPGIVKHFNILRSNNFNADYEVITSLSSKETSYSDRQIKPDVVYYYKLQAVPFDGNKPIFSNVIFAAGFNPQLPVPPYISVSKGVRGGAMLHIQVTDTEAAGVRIYRNDGEGGKLFPVSNLLKVPDSLIVVYNDTANHLSGRKNYIYSAKTESTSFIESGFADSVYVRPVISNMPENPKDLSVYEENGKVRLFWENMEATDQGIAGYRVMRKEESKNSGAVNAPFILLHPDFAILKINFFTDTTAEPAKTYIYKVNSVDIDGNISKQGTIATVSLHSDEPIEPFGLEGYKVDDAIFLTWGQTIYKDISSVNLYRYQRGSKAVLLSKLPADATEYTDNQIKPDNLYFYYLTTVNKSGIESAKSMEIGVE
ncbi:MAG: fibronectin type III domain-containing protein [Omnitrophica WOR_2 bacterium]